MGIFGIYMHIYKYRYTLDHSPLRLIGFKWNGDEVGPNKLKLVQLSSFLLGSSGTAVF